MKRLAILMMLGVTTPAAAQDPSALVARAVTAYEGLELDAAAGLLRRALTPPLDDSLTHAEHTRALSYLGAIELLRERRDSALAVFRRLVLFDPRYRADTYVFPPEVTRLFDEVRLRTRVVAMRVPSDTVVPLQGRFTMWLVPSAAHDVTVAIAREDGRPLRTLYAGPIGDSLQVRWDGRDSTGAWAPEGRLWLTAASSERLVQLPLEIQLEVDTESRPTAPRPEPTLPQPAKQPGNRRALASGLLIGAAAILLPQIVAPGEQSSGTRLAVGGTLAVSGVVGYLTQRPSRSLPNTVATNRARPSDGQRRGTATISGSFRVRSLGPSTVIERGQRAR